MNSIKTAGQMLSGMTRNEENNPELGIIKSAILQAANLILDAAEASGNLTAITRAKGNYSSAYTVRQEASVGIAHIMLIHAKSLELAPVLAFLEKMIELGYMRVFDRIQSGYDFPTEKGRAQRDAVLSACAEFIKSTP